MGPGHVWRNQYIVWKLADFEGAGLKLHDVPRATGLGRRTVVENVRVPDGAVFFPRSLASNTALFPHAGFGGT